MLTTQDADWWRRTTNKLACWKSTTPFRLTRATTRSSNSSKVQKNSAGGLKKNTTSFCKLSNSTVATGSNFSNTLAQDLVFRSEVTPRSTSWKPMSHFALIFRQYRCQIPPLLTFCNRPYKRYRFRRSKFKINPTLATCSHMLWGYRDKESISQS